MRVPNFMDAPEAPLALTDTSADGNAGKASGASAGSGVPCTTFADKFGAIPDIELPLRMAPVDMPSDIDTMLTFGSSSGDRLLKETILFNWEGEGWAVGTIIERSIDPKLKHLTRRKTKELMNLKVHYAVDDATEPHVLSTRDYATSAMDPAGKWCLLGADERPLPPSAMPARFTGGRAASGRGRKGRGRGGAALATLIDGGAVVATVVERVEVPAPATAPDIQGLAAMLTPEQKALLLAELQK